MGSAGPSSLRRQPVGSNDDGGPKSPRPGRPQRYVPADIVVVEACSHHYDNISRALRNLKDPKTWNRLRKTAKRAFPNDKTKRLSKKAPNRFQMYRAKSKYFAGEALQVRLGKVIAEAGLAEVVGVSARSLRLHAARKVLDTDGIEAAARLLGSPSLDSTASALGYRWSPRGG